LYVPLTRICSARGTRFNQTRLVVNLLLFHQSKKLILKNFIYYPVFFYSLRNQHWYIYSVDF